ncbi:hypothetical protein CP985_03225 [Malaciobacter mytili LMG 24559]|uniref:Uncharacterized protein n=1 Tax=Malaciobacter mytili LMG 24559 TaxID=1032238 RepID=A0AAX2AIP3_9BACT|nr:hypothetical protein [Malaciobacter mytili]AXH16371.1 hypothetical protein AMYT_a0071 [Malaciobacter mytili LMG 24559]RXK16435.1 hypothetical protein CP985_03225 [Malaciobacter mytili LMG 24559]
MTYPRRDLLINRSSDFLLLLLKQKQYTFSNLKEEVLLTFCLNLLDCYFNADLHNEKKLLPDFIDVGQRQIINNHMSILKEYLEKQVISYQTLENLIKNKNRLMEPYGFLYNKLAALFRNHVQNMIKKEEKFLWIPDMLVIYLISDMKEFNYKFSKFDYIRENSFEDILNIYHKTDSILKIFENKSNSKDIEDQTVIKRMSNLSLKIIGKYNTIKYKSY